MFGTNQISPPIFGDGNELNIVEIFPTLQGEGKYTGWPAVFIRLGNCNLACKFCDTEFEKFEQLQLSAIIEQVRQYSVNQQNERIANLVVITGGEPFLQPIEALCQKLLADDFIVQIETNGTLYREIPQAVDIICSPKMTNGKYLTIRDDLLKRITGLKFIISKDNYGYQDVEEVGQGRYNIPVYVQPMDEYDTDKNKQNLVYTVKLALEQGYILSLQVHKIVGID
ncbi:MAG: 7-carboxy-7-deazaguanine synthase QueE [Pseudomonadota bacterium]